MELNYLICCGLNDSNRKSEKKGYTTCQQDAPPFQLELINVIVASKYGRCYVNQKNAHKPPLRNLFISSHELRVHIHILLFESRLAQQPYFSACLKKLVPLTKRNVILRNLCAHFLYGNLGTAITKNCEEHSQIQTKFLLALNGIVQPCKTH